MYAIQTTLGPLTINQLGRVNIHEHVVIDISGNSNIPKDFHHVELEPISSELSEWKQAGGGLLIDCSPIGAGRNILIMEQISQLSEIPIVVCSGFHKLSYYDCGHWLMHATQEEILDIILSECNQGIVLDDTNPHNSKRSSIKSNMLKIGLDHEGFNPIITRILSAISIVIAQTGIPCVIHTEPGVPFDQTIAQLKNFSFLPEKTVFCHMGKSLDFNLLLKLAKAGFYLEFDEMIRPVPKLEILAKAILQLFQAGYGNKVLFAGDFARRSYWSCFNGKPGLKYLITGLQDELKKYGFCQDMLDQIWISNPQELFS